MNITQKTIILTGAASGIGRALLTQLSHYDCTVIAADINQTQLETVASTLADHTASIYCFTGDISQASDVDSLFAFALEQASSIDLFVANAGFAYYETLKQVDWQHIERIFQLNTVSPIYAALKMRDLNQGRSYKVVVTASAMAHWALPGYALYSGTKAALDRFATAYRTELDDPSALMLVYPIATRTNFFEQAGQSDKRIAPTPFPSQTADYVAQQMIRGIEGDKRSVYPSILFRLAFFLNRFLPMEWLVRSVEDMRFKRWLKGD